LAAEREQSDKETMGDLADKAEPWQQESAVVVAVQVQSARVHQGRQRAVAVRACLLLFPALLPYMAPVRLAVAGPAQPQERQGLTQD
jgi:hypothetical protein